ncbi:hypothetical protein GCM10017600_70280 [Streptosporangium carneum]|uniref:Uncharacterized protein n=1 Tax=Streptosporangium carneum TaxID=47481 RepID=A0A9W6MGY6_9ACTN|nr:hypothetical protein GCM10017600_70280 [Streptosporangium carneum]
MRREWARLGSVGGRAEGGDRAARKGWSTGVGEARFGGGPACGRVEGGRQGGTEAWKGWSTGPVDGGGWAMGPGERGGWRGLSVWFRCLSPAPVSASQTSLAGRRGANESGTLGHEP